MKIYLIVLSVVFVCFTTFYIYASEKGTKGIENNETNKEAVILLARSPGGCSSEQCCHDQMQQCYDNGGGTECSDQYEACVNSLSD